MALEKVKMLDAQRSNLVSFRSSFMSSVPGLPARMTEDFEDRFDAFCQRLADSLSDLAAAW